MVTVLVVVGLVVAGTVVYWGWRGLLGAATGARLAAFSNEFLELRQKGLPQKDALRGALRRLSGAPGLGDFNEDDIRLVVDIWGELDDPSRPVEDLVLKVDSSKLLIAFRNKELLREVLAIERRRHAR